MSVEVLRAKCLYKNISDFPEEVYFTLLYLLNRSAKCRQSIN